MNTQRTRAVVAFMVLFVLLETLVLASPRKANKLFLHDKIQAVIVVDGPQPDPPKYIYDFNLTFPNNDVVWHTRLNVRSRLRQAEVNEQAAKRFTQRLLDGWLKSAKRAGLPVGDKVS